MAHYTVVQTVIFGSGPVPFGRRADVLANIPQDEHGRLAWLTSNTWNGFGDSRLVRFPARDVLRAAFEKQENARVLTERPKRELSPVLKF